jgi:hypothetical protein
MNAWLIAVQASGRESGSKNPPTRCAGRFRDHLREPVCTNLAVMYPKSLPVASSVTTPSAR